MRRSEEKGSPFNGDKAIANGENGKGGVLILIVPEVDAIVDSEPSAIDFSE